MISPAASCEAAGFFTWPSAAKKAEDSRGRLPTRAAQKQGGCRWGKTHTYEDKKGKTAVFRLNYIDRKENMHKNEGIISAKKIGRIRGKSSHPIDIGIKK